MTTQDKHHEYVYMSVDDGIEAPLEEINEAIHALSRLDERKLFDLACEYGLEGVFPFEVVVPGTEPPSSLGTWSNLLAQERREETLLRNLAEQIIKTRR